MNLKEKMDLNAWNHVLFVTLGKKTQILILKKNSKNNKINEIVNYNFTTGAPVR